MSATAYAPVSGKHATPFSQPTVVLTKQDDSALTWEAHDGRAPHARLVPREAAWKAQGEALEAPRRDLTQRLDGKKSEPSAGSEALGQSQPAHPRKRGQHPGSPGHGRRDRSMLPVVVAVPDVSEAATHCPPWGEAVAPFPGVEACDSLDVQGQAHMRRLQRPRSQQTWRCPQVPGMVTAPPAPRVLPQSP